MAPIQVAIFGLQQSQQQCLSFFTECVKYWEKVDLRRDVSTARPTLEKLAMSQKVLMGNLGHGPDRALHYLRNAIGTCTESSSDREGIYGISRPQHVMGGLIRCTREPDHCQ